MARYSFGPFVLDSALRALLRDNRPVCVTTKVFETLLVLVANRGHVMTKDQLLATLWPSTAVEEANLAQHISTLRRVLEDNPKEHRFIATITGRGYCFVAQVVELPEMPMRPGPSGLEDSQGASARHDKSNSSRLHYSLLGGGAALCVGLLIFLSLRNRGKPLTFYSSIPFTTSMGSEICPSFAPDGERVAFAWNGEHKDNFDIYIKQVGEATLLRLTSDPRPDMSPAWSPDGRKIAYLRLNSDDRGEVLIMSSIAASPPRSLATVTAPLTLYPQLRFLAWSPDSRWLAVSDGPTYGGVMGLYLLSVETGEKRALTLPPREYDDVEPAFAPDMKHLAFVRYSGGGTVASDLYLLNLSPDLKPMGSPERLTFFNGHTASPVWTSDSHSILFTRTEQVGNHSIWRVGAFDRSNAEPLPLSADSSSALDLSRRGNRLVYARERSNINVWAVSLSSRHEGRSSNAPRPWINSSFGAANPQFSPDGKRIAFQSAITGKEEIWMCDRDGSHARQLTHMDAIISGFPRWSPNGKQIVFHSRPHGLARLYMVEADGGIARPLGSVDAENYAPSWSHDGKWIYFTSRRTGNIQVWKMPANGGPEIQVTKSGGWAPLESADGVYLYYIRLPSFSLWRLQLAGGEESQVLPQVQGFGSAYALGRDGVYFIRRGAQGNRVELAYLVSASGQVEELTEISRPVGLGLAVAPNESLLLYSQVDQIGSDLMLVEGVH